MYCSISKPSYIFPYSLPTGVNNINSLVSRLKYIYLCILCFCRLCILLLRLFLCSSYHDDRSMLSICTAHDTLISSHGYIWSLEKSLEGLRKRVVSLLLLYFLLILLSVSPCFTLYVWGSRCVCRHSHSKKDSPIVFIECSSRTHFLDGCDEGDDEVFFCIYV